MTCDQLPVDPQEIEKRRRWYEMRARLDAKFDAEHPGWDDYMRERGWKD